MATLRIFSGGAPKEIFLQLTPQFERQSGHKADYVFAVMSALRDKLAAGEKADVLVMPTNILDGYQKDGAVLAQHRAILGLVPINAVVRTGAPKPDLSTPEKVKQAILKSRAITHATPGATPSGTHMGKLIDQLGIAEPREDAADQPGVERHRLRHDQAQRADHRVRGIERAKRERRCVVLVDLQLERVAVLDVAQCAVHRVAESVRGEQLTGGAQHPDLADR